MVAIKKMLLVFVFLVSVSFGAKYEFVGNFEVGQLLSDFCLIEGCNVFTTPEIASLKIPFVISTDKKHIALDKIKKALHVNEVLLVVHKNDITLKKVTQKEMKSFLDFENNVQSVQKDDFHLYLKRDSILKAEKEKRDSLEKIKISETQVKKEVNFENFTLTYISFSKNLLSDLGLEWGSEFVTGSFHKIPDLVEVFKVKASSISDTSFIYRQLSFALDSSIVVDWGSEEPVIKKTYNNAGIIVQEYEEKKHGLSIKINRDSLHTFLSYVIRANDEKSSVINGSSSQHRDSTLSVSGYYTHKKERITGIPFLSSIPFISSLFSIKTILHDMQYFIILLEKK
jgi:hypothetical protein